MEIVLFNEIPIGDIISKYYTRAMVLPVLKEMDDFDRGYISSALQTIPDKFLLIISVFVRYFPITDLNSYLLRIFFDSMQKSLSCTYHTMIDDKLQLCYSIFGGYGCFHYEVADEGIMAGLVIMFHDYVGEYRRMPWAVKCFQLVRDIKSCGTFIEIAIENVMTHLYFETTIVMNMVNTLDAYSEYDLFWMRIELGLYRDEWADNTKFRLYNDDDMHFVGKWMKKGIVY